jgi:hypothetical protein
MRQRRSCAALGWYTCRPSVGVQGLRCHMCMCMCMCIMCGKNCPANLVLKICTGCSTRSGLKTVVRAEGRLPPPHDDT